jgi:hypothetical protein
MLVDCIEALCWHHVEKISQTKIQNKSLPGILRHQLTSCSAWYKIIKLVSLVNQDIELQPPEAVAVLIPTVILRE